MHSSPSARERRLANAWRTGLTYSVLSDWIGIRRHTKKEKGRDSMINKVIEKMIRHDQGDPRRIQHFLKVHSFAKYIGECEGLDKHTQLILETAALVHDIGIRPAEEKYGRCDGKLQEQEGPKPAEDLLMEAGCPGEIIERVCYLVGHHHTYQNVDGMDYQILLEADFLVNLYEDSVSSEGIKNALQRIFVTKTGKEICETMFLKER